MKQFHISTVSLSSSKSSSSSSSSSSSDSSSSSSSSSSATSSLPSSSSMLLFHNNNKHHHNDDDDHDDVEENHSHHHHHHHHHNNSNNNTSSAVSATLIQEKHPYHQEQNQHDIMVNFGSDDNDHNNKNNNNNTNYDYDTFYNKYNNNNNNNNMTNHIDHAVPSSQQQPLSSSLYKVIMKKMKFYIYFILCLLFITLCLAVYTMMNVIHLSHTNKNSSTGTMIHLVFWMLLIILILLVVIIIVVGIVLIVHQRSIKNHQNQNDNNNQNNNCDKRITKTNRNSDITTIPTNNSCDFSNHNNIINKIDPIIKLAPEQQLQPLQQQQHLIIDPPNHQNHNSDGKPIAELYPETTIMLADLVGFTAWSSARDPTQVFILLETIFIAFDEIALLYNIFKVETVGDCYVAVAGVPEPRMDHAVVMSQFANDCLVRFASLIYQLEYKLGPGTADLGVRIGLHSGPITGGILRGSRSRFQLFGDTINTAARMESNSMKGKIQLSEQTADLLNIAHKEHWLLKRSDKIEAKGKGSLQTYWLNIQCSTKNVSLSLSTTSSSDDNSSNIIDDIDDNSRNKVSGSTMGVIKRTRTRGLSCQHSKLVNFNVECLSNLLKQILARRAISHDYNMVSISETIISDQSKPIGIIHEVTDCIKLPAFHAGIERNVPIDVNTIQLDTKIVQQLHDLLTEICQRYNSSNYFHNFEYATHVAMSVLKLIGRIVSPLELLSKQCGSERRLNASKLYDHTFGLTSDPLTLFACAYSALIHCVDHPGVPNSVLINENGELAQKYNEQSIVEQNAFDVAWNFLMDNRYVDLQAAIFSTPSEKEHFRQIVINCVMAMDMYDPQLMTLRNQRWDSTFGSNKNNNNTTIIPKRRQGGRDMDNRKATIVIEHLMQTSNIAHTMQHWHIYRKWNERLYREQLVAFLMGRTIHDPTIDWYNNEIKFFDTIVIPLAKKLKDCGVFGVSSSEYLNYALNNRKEWECIGIDIVNEMNQRCKPEIMGEIMKHMKESTESSTLKIGSTGGSGIDSNGTVGLQCAISDQFGPDSLLLTTLWSKADSTSILGPPVNDNSTDDDGSTDN